MTQKVNITRTVVRAKKMDSLLGKTVGGTREETPFAGSSLSENIDKTGTAFARKVSISRELMPTDVAS
ncbi:hypothetical protein, partial [Endozoicomonas sp. ALC066]|uniref:hypothetical protein n=1 Tax=Endozoicomonas sp. ALC066 TaxID=3403078 RepID=UPI003BB626A3